MSYIVYAVFCFVVKTWKEVHTRCIQVFVLCERRSEIQARCAIYVYLLAKCYVHLSDSRFEIQE